MYQKTDAAKSHPVKERSRLDENSNCSWSGRASGIILNSLCKSSPSNTLLGVTACGRGDLDGISVT